MTPETSAMDVHESMRSSDFSPIDRAIAGSLQDSEILGVVRVENDLIDSRLDNSQYGKGRPCYDEPR